MSDHKNEFARIIGFAREHAPSHTLYYFHHIFTRDTSISIFRDSVGADTIRIKDYTSRACELYLYANGKFELDVMGETVWGDNYSGHLLTQICLHNLFNWNTWRRILNVYND